MCVGISYLFYFSCVGKTKFSFKSVKLVNEKMNCQKKLSVLSAKLLFYFCRLVYNVTVLLAMADCQAKTDESAEIIILSCTAETRQPQAIEAI